MKRLDLIATVDQDRKQELILKTSKTFINLVRFLKTFNSQIDLPFDPLLGNLKCLSRQMKYEGLIPV